MKPTRIVIAATAVLTLAACGGDPTATSSPPTPVPTTAAPPETMTTVGTLTLSGPHSATMTGGAGEPCFGTGGYTDLQVGAQVTVTDAAGATVALGSVSSSVAGGMAATALRTCEFSFSVDDVPRGKNFYEVEIADRNGPQYTEEQMGLPLSLTLGD